jgi:hypothetical protein
MKWYLGAIHGFGDCLFKCQEPFKEETLEVFNLTKIMVDPNRGIGFMKYFASNTNMTASPRGVMNRSAILWLYEASTEAAKKADDLWNADNVVGGNGIIRGNALDFEKLKRQIKP